MPLRRKISVLVASLLCVGQLTGPVDAQTPEQPAAKDMGALDVGKPVEQSIKGGESHRYTIRLEAGQLLKATVEQKGVDVAVALLGPDGKPVLEVDSPNGANGPEPVLVVVEASGAYTLEVKTLDPADKGGRYDVRVEEVRAAMETDRVLAEATKAMGASVLLSASGKPGEAIPHAERATALYEKALGPDHTDVAASLNNLALLYRATGAYAKAEPLQVRALAIYEKALGPDHPKVATVLSNLAQTYLYTGAYAKAEPLYVRTLAVREKALGPDHRDVAFLLNDLAILYLTTLEYAKAEPLQVRALAIYEKAFGPDHPEVANALNHLAHLYVSMGAYAKAEPLFMRSLAVREKALGPDHPKVADALISLAQNYFATGAYAKAEPLQVRGVAICEKALGPNHREVAFALHDLAITYQVTGAYAKAEPLLVRALAICEKVFGPDHGFVASELRSLADLYRETGVYAKAEPLLVRALAIDEKAFGPDHGLVAVALDSLGRLYRETGAYAKAKPLLVRSLAVREKAFGPDHRDVATALKDLALLHEDTGEHAKAEPLYARALAIYEKALGPDHPELAKALNNLATLYHVTGAYAEALEAKRRANDVTERDLMRNLASGSEQRKLQYLATTAFTLDATVSLHLRALPSDPQAARAALEVVLRRKGRALDAMTDAIASLRRRASAEDQALLDQLAIAQSQLATVTLRGPGREGVERYRQALSELEEQVDRLQSQVSSRSAEYRVQTTPITLDAVERAVPEGATLVEYAVYLPYEAKAERAKRFGAARYAVYTLTSTGQLAWRDLGEAAPIDAAITELREALWDRKRRDVRRLARALEAKVFAPARQLAGAPRRLLISPDGALNLIPFGALVDERGRYLVETHELTYLTSGRDLLRLAERGDAKQGAMIVADPAYGDTALAEATEAREILVKKAESGEQSTDFGAVEFSPLAFTAVEARALGGLLKSPTVLVREAATEAAMKKASAPRILHVATHGFFLPDLEVRGADDGGQRTADSGPKKIENPLLRSGLALAGANARKSGEDDGVLTALEVAGLDLWGTKLVVLSACETGVGEVKTGDGVYGLRRALVLAGSESQVMSLWKVSDRATRDLMVAYYRGLLAGQGRTAALRRVQLRMLRSPATRHPFYWASFIQSGAWGPLGAGPDARP